MNWTKTTLLAAITMVAAQTPTPTSGTNPGPTLVSGWYYVRAVAEPNFHSYLQTQPTGVPSDAFLDDPANAGQFNIIDGQLVYYTGTGGELYLHVENPEDKTQRTLETWFETVENDYGAFAFQGDTVTWHVDDIARPNEAAWLVCGEQQLFVNTGAYAYDTPAGCADQTVSDEVNILERADIVDSLLWRFDTGRLSLRSTLVNMIRWTTLLDIFGQDRCAKFGGSSTFSWFSNLTRASGEHQRRPSKGEETHQTV